MSVRVDIHGLAPGGDAVGRQVEGAEAGRVVFVPFAAPGERVRAQLRRQRARVAWAELEHIETPSPARVPAPCPLFTRCGGCQWQHVDGPTQLQAKHGHVVRALTEPGGVPVATRSPSPSYGYRDRAKLVVGQAVGEPSGSGAPTLGFRARQAHTVIDVASCALLAPALEHALPLVRAWVAAAAPETEVILQAGRNVVGASAGGRHARVVDGALIEQGEPVLLDVAEPGSPSLVVATGAFAQVGMAANRALVDEVLTQVGDSPGRVLELFAGAGNFTRHLAGRAEHLVAADGDARAVERGRTNAPDAQWLLQRRSSAYNFDTAVVDPPRAGLDADTLDWVAKAQVRIVYVSCDPQTLGRDARVLAGRGFRLARATALDLMPQTFHTEVVATFERMGGQKAV